jgi:hypothetical protein
VPLELHSSDETENPIPNPPERLLRAWDTTAALVSVQSAPQPRNLQAREARQLDGRSPDSASEEYIRRNFRSLQI